VVSQQQESPPSGAVAALCPFPCSSQLTSRTSLRLVRQRITQRHLGKLRGPCKCEESSESSPPPDHAPSGSESQCATACSSRRLFSDLFNVRFKGRIQNGPSLLHQQEARCWIEWCCAASQTSTCGADTPRVEHSRSLSKQDAASRRAGFGATVSRTLPCELASVRGVPQVSCQAALLYRVWIPCAVV
jgi:hypothetical protein